MICKKCQKDKDDSHFHAKKKACKSCVSEYNKEYHLKTYPFNEDIREGYKKRASIWAKNNPEKRAIIAKNRNLKEKIEFPEKVKCRQLVNQRVRFGRMPRPSSLPCHYCAKQAEHYHHYKGYNFENRYDVLPVCAKCHSSKT